MTKHGPSHGARHRHTGRQRIYYAAHNAARKARKMEHTFILDRFLNSPRHRKSQTAIGWDEDFCARYDTIAAEDHSYIATQTERSRNENSWKLVLKTPGTNGPMEQRDDNQEAERICVRQYEEHGKGNTRLHSKDQVRQRRSQQFIGTEEEGSERVEPQNGLEVAQPSINKFFLVELASSFMVDIFIME